MTSGPRFLSALPGIVWPAMGSPRASALLAMQFVLERSQWLSGETLAAAQLRQLAPLLEHAVRTVPFYASRPGADAARRSDAPLTLERWRELPLLTRDDIVEEFHRLRSRAVPRGHGQLRERRSSGSSGRDVRVVSTSVGTLMWHALTMRDHLWHAREPSGGLCVIRSGRYAEDPDEIRSQDSWGPPMSWVFETGPGTVFYHLLPLDRQAEIIASRDPEYLLLYPSAALALSEHFRRRKLELGRLREVRTYAEPLGADVRRACREQWGVPVTDMYSAEEVGYIALQCPRHEHYHVQSESVLVEVLDDDGEPCAAGEVGRVVVTVLHNFAMPLLRYAIGDFARVGAACECGRGLPVIEQVVGRERNRVRLPDGRHVWPDFPKERWSALVPASQIQVAQVARDALEVRLEMGREPTAREREALDAALIDALGHAFDTRFVALQTLQRPPNGKLERFVRSFDRE